MNVHVEFYAGLKRLVGTPKDEVSVPSETSAGDLIEQLVEECDSLSPDVMNSVAVAVNDELVSKTHKLEAGDKICLLPPISGGA